MDSSDFASKRPTLPPLHSLHLPFPLLRKSSLQDTSPNHCSVIGSWCHTHRQVSESSSPTSSPTPSDGLHTHPLSSLSPWTFPQTFRLVPCAFEEATAVLVVPPPPSTSSPLLFTGSSLNQLLHSHSFGKGARIHPYRIAPSTRRLSSSSTSSQ